MNTEDLRRRLHIALILNALIVGGEFAGGAWIHSVGLMSDAVHNLIDQGALFLTLFAYLLARRPATATSTFGFHRAGIVTALVNAVLLIIAALGLTAVAGERLFHPVLVPGGWIIGIALMSFAANMAIALLLQSAAKEDLNIRGAFWHMFGDAWVCFGVALSGGVTLLTHWTFIDPLISLVVVAAILKGVWPILKESLEILMESAPRGLTTKNVSEALQKLPGVRNVHDLHLWTVKPGMTFLTCHVMTDQPLSQSLLTSIRAQAAKECGVQHMTVQLEASCCHAEAVHCDLQRISRQHQRVFEVQPAV